MRIIRFLGDDHGTHYGVPIVPGDGSVDSAQGAHDSPDGGLPRAARVVADPQGVLGPLGPDPAGARRALFHGMRAVVADDDANMRELMSTVLTRMGCTCEVCHDGAETLSAIERGEVDLVVSDIVMPHYNGYEIYSTARQARSDLPVVLVTGFGYDPSHSLVKAEKDGLETILYKPFTPQQLVEEVVRAVSAVTPHPSEALIVTDQVIAIDRVLAPLNPANVICVGSNWHAARTPAMAGSMDGRGDASADAGDLEVFMKPTTAVQDPDGPIVIPALPDGTPRLAAEGELALVIGRTCRHVEPEDVDQYVLGYLPAIDVTARRFQTTEGPPRWMRGKGFDTFCPLGPAICTADEVGPVDARTVRTLVNDRVIRTGTTADMLRSVRRIVSEVSRYVTLHAGTVLLTGAPPLVEPDGDFDPARDLEPGDVVSVEVEGIGRLSSTVCADDDLTA